MRKSILEPCSFSGSTLSGSTLQSTYDCPQGW
jgi:hypothetical protein